MKNSSASTGKLEKWLSSPTLRAHGRSAKVPRKVSFREIGSEKEKKTQHPVVVNGENTVCASAIEQSPFRTPPSTLYSSHEVLAGFNQFVMAARKRVLLCFSLLCFLFNLTAKSEVTFAAFFDVQYINGCTGGVASHQLAPRLHRKVCLEKI